MLKKKFQLTLFVSLSLLFPTIVFSQVLNPENEFEKEIRNELAITPGLPSTIDVALSNGILELRGSVESLLQKEMAGEVTENISGTKSVINLLKVNAPPVSDDSIVDALLTTLKENPATEAYDVRINVRDAVIQLNGTVDSWHEREMAGYIAKTIRGVVDVVNELSLAQVENAPADNEIETDIETSIAANRLLNNTNIIIEVESSTVKLEGNVNSLREKKLVENLAWVPGVDKVITDELTYMPQKDTVDDDEHEYSDEEVEYAVIRALNRDPRLVIGPLNVEVVNGKAVISGQAATLQMKQMVNMLVMNINGVESIENNLELRNMPVEDNEPLETRIEAAFERNPYLNSLNIEAESYNGTVRLTGLAETFFEKNLAGQIASSFSGVKSLHNNISVTSDMFTGKEYGYKEFNYIYLVPNLPLLQENAYKTDWEIKNSIENQLKISSVVDQHRVSVTVENGTATLEGAVKSEDAISEAIKNAYDGGATDVVNQLYVR